jgi:hypothetical protein
MLKVNPKLKFLCNNFNGRWESYHRVFDGGVCELNENLINEKDLDKLYKKADELGKTQLFNSNSKDPAKLGRPPDPLRPSRFPTPVHTRW